jgi:predicted transcriptional regulator
MALITHDKALELIKRMVRDEGSQIAVAKKLDITPSFLSDILRGRRTIPDSVAQKLGYRRVVMFCGE